MSRYRVTNLYTPHAPKPTKAAPPMAHPMMGTAAIDAADPAIVATPPAMPAPPAAMLPPPAAANAAVVVAAVPVLAAMAAAAAASAAAVTPETPMAAPIPAPAAAPTPAAATSPTLPISISLMITPFIFKGTSTEFVRTEDNGTVPRCLDSIALFMRITGIHDYFIRVPCVPS